MIYTEMTRKAMQIMYRQHQGQFDKAGVPYCFHPWHVAENMPDEDSACAALLHDVLEDTDMTLDRLRAEGFNEAVLTAVRLLTHDPALDYGEYMERLAADPIARRVKLADLQHNADLTRFDYVTTSDMEHHRKYIYYLSWLEHYTEGREAE